MAAFKLKNISAILLGEMKSAPNDQVRLCVHNIALSMADKFKQADDHFDREAWYMACGLPKNGFMDFDLFDLSNGHHKDESFGEVAKKARIIKIQGMANLTRQQAAATLAGKPGTDPELIMASTLDFAEQLTAKFDGVRIGGTIFSVKKGYKFHKIMLHDSKGRSGSIHCFIEKSTGAVCKAASLNAPARHADKSLISNYNISTAHGFKIAVNAADWTGSYLYNRPYR